MAVTSTEIKHFTDFGMTVSDDTGTPLSSSLVLYDGTFSIDGIAAKLRNVNAYETQGAMRSLRYGARRYVTFTVSGYVATFSSATHFIQAVLKNGATWGSAVSTTATKGDVFTVDMDVTWEGTDLGDSADHTFSAEDCHFTLAIADGEPLKFTASATCYGPLTGDIAVAE